METFFQPLSIYGLRASTTIEGVCEKTKGKIKYNALGFGKVDDNVFVSMEMIRIGQSLCLYCVLRFL